MSTAFYAFRGRISSARLAEGPGHDVVAVWQRGAKIGELTVTKGTGKEVLAMFRSEAPAFHAYYGGEESGTVVEATEDGKGMPPSEYVLSEDGELFTVHDVLQLAGRGKKA